MRPVSSSSMKLLVARLVGVFFLPLVVATVTLQFIDESDAKDTFHHLLPVAAAPLALCLLIQVGAMAFSLAAQVGSKRFLRLHRMTSRGRWFLATSLLVLVLALVTRWASLATLAVMALGVFYAASTAAAVVAARAGRSTFALDCRRTFSPSDLTVGEDTRVELALGEVRIPALFHLVLEDRLPERLQTSIRAFLTRAAHGCRATLQAQLARTPRGVFELPPPHLFYQDLLGLTRVDLPSRYRTTTLRILPAVPDSGLLEQLPRLAAEEDLLSRVYRRQGDPFQFREYVPGDDTRRINWKLSLKSGRLIVREPEKIPVGSRVQLIMDTFSDLKRRPGSVLDLAQTARMDALVEAWLAAAARFQKQGFEVVLRVLGKGSPVILARHSSHGLLEAREAGAEAEWQSTQDLDRSWLATDSIVFSARLAPWPRSGLRQAVWAFLPFATEPLTALAGSGWRRWFFIQEVARADTPSGRSAKRLRDVKQRSQSRWTELLASAQRVYRIEKSLAGIRFQPSGAHPR